MNKTTATRRALAMLTAAATAQHWHQTSQRRATPTLLWESNDSDANVDADTDADADADRTCELATKPSQAKPSKAKQSKVKPSQAKQPTNRPTDHARRQKLTEAVWRTETKRRFAVYVLRASK